MDFELSAEEQAFSADVEAFLDEHATPDVADVCRENMAQIVDTPERRVFMKKLSDQGWLGMSWPKEYGGKEMPGIYEYILNEALARRGAPQIGKGIGIIGKTLIRHGSDKLKAEFLPQIINAQVEFAVGYSEPQAGSDAANMQLKAEKVDGGWMLNGQKTWTTSAHFADWYWVGARTDQAKKHDGISLFLIPMDHEGLEVRGMPTIGDELTNEVFFNDVFVPDDYLVGDAGKGFRYISEALDLERFTMFTYSPTEQRMEELIDYVKSATRDGKPLKDDPHVRSRIAKLSAEGEVARVLGLTFVHAAGQVGAKPPTNQASQYKLFATQLSQRVANAMMDLPGAGAQLRVYTGDAPLRGRPEMSYRYSVIDTIGGGASEIQKNIIARRKLGLPKNF
ncbi:MAG: acyl-CoA dehydrogenase family protein [Deltaproteobacteria bacterium]|nr:acyl-CoA dehydrogenase family protein [Deltaproteobacteria bacterium]MBW2445554.1 acyl-CoA dehydrogenase family protein [Deltaproteobacteria bacterium]